MTMLQLAGPAGSDCVPPRKAPRRAPLARPDRHRRGRAFRAFRERRSARSTADEQRVLEALLDYGGGPAPSAAGRQRIYVVPRLGTISPWASKATDIAKICSLPVLRIERGRVVRARRCSSVLTDAERKRIAPLLHDRMTETLLAERPQRGAAVRRARAAARARRRRARRRPRGARARQRRDRPRAVGRRDRLSGGAVRGAAAQSDRRRAHDVRAGELRALPPQDLQRRLGHRRPASAEEPVRDDQEHARALAGRACCRPTRTMPPSSRAPRPRGSGPTLRPASTATPQEPAHLVMKVETHNHPTAISPFPGAATGSGGEIRDEGATGRGAKPKAGLVGFTVSHLELPGLAPALGACVARQAGPHRLAARRSCSTGRSARRASTTSSAGRTSPVISARACSKSNGVWRGYHKPIMIAGGLGNVRGANVVKADAGPRRQARRARRAGDADRLGRRRRFVARQRRR